MRPIVVAVIMVVVLSSPSLLLADLPTFRLAALEYRGRTWDHPDAVDPASSDFKWSVMIAGIDYHLTEQAAAGTPVDVIVTAELPTHPYPRGEEIDTAQYVPGPRTDAIAALAVAHNCWIVVNPSEKDTNYASNGILHHSSLVYNRQGDLVANHRKHILPAGSEFTPGPGPTVISTEFGNMAVLNCWEIDPDPNDPNYPTDPQKHQQLILDTMALDPHVIVHPSWGAYKDWVVQLAVDYGVYIASSCWDGSSSIAGPDGLLDEQLYTGNRALPWDMKLAVADVPVPEPTTAVLLAAVAVGKLLRKRKKR